MCGIAAILGPGAASHAEAPRREAALRSLAPRGPDGQGQWSCDATGMVWLGHRRLAIVDLSPAGAQPMVSDDGALAVTFNGEIYNAPALRSELKARGAQFCSHSDTEVLLHGYRAWGIHSLIDRLRGMFAFVLWDEASRQAHAAVDHVGMKPLYYAADSASSTGKTIRIASTADAVRALGATDHGVDRHALAHVLCHGYIPAPLTAWKGISKLAPGTAMSWRTGDERTSIWRHWEPPSERGQSSDEDFAPMWERVVGEHHQSDVPVGLLLSSGIDSSAVAVASSRIGQRPSCVTLALEGADDESSIAAQTAMRLGLPHASAALAADHVPALIDRAAAAFDEPQGYGALLTMTAVSPVARTHAKVFLAGDGGDEAFAGYTWHREPLTPAARPSTADERSQALRVASPDATPAQRHAALDTLAHTSPLHAYAQRVHPLMHPAEAAALFDTTFDDDAYLAHLREAARPMLPWPRRAQAIDLMCFCAGSILPKVDRAAMACGLEVRAPFLDRRVLEWALARPLAAGETAAPKSVLRRYIAPHVPDIVLSAPKRGFSLRTDWSAAEPELRRRIGASRLVKDGVLRAEWDRFAQPSVPYAQRRVFALSMLAAWYERRCA